jgi:hypothetical protein
VELLPPDIKARLQDLLRDPRVSQLEVTRRINDLLEDRGEDLRLSKSAVNRYNVRMKEAGDKLRQSREVAEMWIGKLGAAPQGQVGNLVNEILRTLAFDLSLVAQEGQISSDNAPAVAGMLKDLALAMQRLERAASENVKREEEIRRQERERLAAKMEEAAKEHPNEFGPEAVRRIRALYGIHEEA